VRIDRVCSAAAIDVRLERDILAHVKNIHLRKHHRGHPWIFSNEIRHKDDIPPGDIVNIHRGSKFLGRGFYNPHSLIAIRRFTEVEEEFNQQFVNNMVDRAFAYRRKFTREKSFRLIHSESDGLPGLIVDKYEDNLVIQINCYGIDRRRNMIVESLARMQPLFIYEKSDSHARRLEGLEPKQGLLYGTLVAPLIIRQDRIPFMVDIEGGQKTGFFFDLSEVRRKVKKMCGSRKVLDLFCYTGAFSLYAAHGGAYSVTGVDSSKTAIALAVKNSKLTNTKAVEFFCADAFDFLRHAKERYDVIIVDPPSFAKSKKSLTTARQGYKNINYLAMLHLERNGLLVTTSCSHHLGEQEFVEILHESARDTGRNFRIIDRATQSPDHPVLLSMPESRYLKCLFLQRVD
jgi:23S rRNA (cytosine1962-C5)-methyltransferase